MMAVLSIFGLLTGWSVMAVKVLMLLFLAGRPSNIFLIQPPTNEHSLLVSVLEQLLPGLVGTLETLNSQEIDDLLYDDYMMSL